MTRVELRGDLEQVLARALADKVQQVAGQVAAAAAEGAPAAHTWVTSADEQVRPSHAAADGQTIPGNLRFRVPAMVYVRKGRSPGGQERNPAGGWKILPDRVDVGRAPRDKEFPVHQRAECRCVLLVDPGAVGAAVRPGPATVAGTVVVARVNVVFPRVAESEFPSGEDGGGGWLRQAAKEVAARHK